ncbi:hypothetical protein SAMN04487949_1765 [Halogranum gelatinilyticum]|uniref:Uncharacterized protein n=1 Tax=Halogranum gelatinilyticum TaxID=660521 RepID=A0A1G9TGJ3_9EURY|nr:hypothetical protein [Halogranum gelatinilyticum]SDM46837.1 hypothetical protein SAMN04487949_1765 [Halogranum gelatinilyticum]
MTDLDVLALLVLGSFALLVGVQLLREMRPSTRDYPTNHESRTKNEANR